MRWIVAESGGTKTQWKFYEGGVSFVREGKSLHPEELSGDLLKEERSFWNDFNIENIPLTFYGAGAIHPKGRSKILDFLKKIGFKTIKLQSDLVAAATASYKQNSGWVAILGTGSVLFYWNGKEIEKIIGGKGHLVGDEGSGYYFGKLVLTAWENEKLNEKQVSEWKKIEKVPQKHQKSEVASLVKKLSHEFDDFHRENLRLFAEKHFLSDIYKVKIIGSYAYFRQEMVREIFAKKNVEVLDFIQYPLDALD